LNKILLFIDLTINDIIAFKFTSIIIIKRTLSPALSRKERAASYRT